MATTPNLNLNLFEGSQRPDKALFNENNLIIDGILKTASTHTHDGTDADKISAKNVTFNASETTLQAINLEDAVKEVFTGADSKIAWITDSIGTATGSISDPDKRFDEINTDFVASRTKYRDDMSRVNRFIVSTGLPDASASLQEIADSIDNTVIDGVTATKDDVLAGITSVTKYGIVEEGTLNRISETKQFMPSQSADVPIARGVYNNITLNGLGYQFPERYIKKGIEIMGVVGTVEERGSNGWDVGESIAKGKTTVINQQECFIKPLITDGDAAFSLPYEVFMYNYNNLKSTDAKHFMASATTGSQVSVVGYNDSFKESVNFSIGATSFMNFKKNVYNNQPLFYVGRYDDTSVKYMYAVCVGNTRSVNTTGSEVIIYNMSSKTTSLKVSFSDIDVKSIIYASPQKTVFNSSIVLVGLKTNGKYVYITINLNADGKAYYHLAEKPSIPFAVTTSGKDIYFVPNYTRTEVSGNITETCSCTVTNLKEALIGLNDKLVFNNMHTMSSVTIKLKSVNTSDNYSILDVNEAVITSGTVRGTKDVIIDVSGKTYFSIKCSSGMIYVQDVLVNGQTIMKDNILFLKPLKQVHYAEQPDNTRFLWGATDYEPSTNTCNSTIVVDIFFQLYSGNTNYSTHHEQQIAINSFNLIDNTRSTLNGGVSNNWGYGQENMLFSTWLDTVEWRVSAAGSKWYRQHRELIRLKYINETTLEIERMQSGTSYKPFRPCFIDSLNRVMGIEASCTPDRFEYFCVLDSTLKGLYSYPAWSETIMRTIDEDLLVLDDGATSYGQGFVTGMIYCYNADGTKSTNKLIGSLQQRNAVGLTATSDFITSIDNSKIKRIGGISALYTNMYKINSTRI